MRFSRLFLWAIGITVGIVVAASLLGLMLPGAVPPIEGMFLAVGFVVLAYEITALGCAAARENGRSPRLMLAATILGALTTAGWLVVIVDHAVFQDVDVWVKWLTPPSVLVAWAMMHGVLHIRPVSHRGVLNVRRVTNLLLLLLALWIAAAVIAYPSNPNRASHRAIAGFVEDQGVRTGAALALISAAGVLATLLGGMMHPARGAALVSGTRQLRYGLTCPRCGDEHEAMTGTHHCARCGLRIRVEVA